VGDIDSTAVRKQDELLDDVVYLFLRVSYTLSYHVRTDLTVSRIRSSPLPAWVFWLPLPRLPVEWTILT